MKKLNTILLAAIFIFLSANYFFNYKIAYNKGYSAALDYAMEEIKKTTDSLKKSKTRVFYYPTKIYFNGKEITKKGKN